MRGAGGGARVPPTQFGRGYSERRASCGPRAFGLGFSLPCSCSFMLLGFLLPHSWDPHTLVGRPQLLRNEERAQKQLHAGCRGKPSHKGLCSSRDRAGALGDSPRTWTDRYLLCLWKVVLMVHLHLNTWALGQHQAVNSEATSSRDLGRELGTPLAARSWCSLNSS